MSLAQRAVYPTQPAPLRQLVEDLLARAEPAAEPADLVALIVPDSNRTSGAAAAAAAFKLLEGSDAQTVVIVSPSHHGRFGRLSVCRADTYHTPLGDVPVNDALRNELCDEDDDIYIDDTGHYHVEGADVQLPFLQVVLPNGFDVVPIVMGEETPAFCRELGAAVGEVLYGRRAVIVGSADILEADGEGLEALRSAIESFDESALMHVLGSESVRAEGMGAVITTALAARQRGATRARVLTLEGPSEGAPGILTVAFTRA